MNSRSSEPSQSGAGRGPLEHFAGIPNQSCPQSARSSARAWLPDFALLPEVQTGKPAVEILEPKGAWAYLQDRPGEAEIFGRAMTAKASIDVGAVTAAYDFTRFGRIADIGGGRGHLLRAILEAAPGAEGVLFDLPMVIDTLNTGDQPRLTLQAGDFFVDALPSAEAYILMEVLHDWADEQCVAILNAIQRAAH